MSVYKKHGREVYSFDFRYRGARFSGSTGCKTKREAERFEEDERARIKASRVDRSKPMTFAVASSVYWDEVGRFHQNGADTERTLAWLQTQIGKATRVAAISNATIAAAVAKRRGEGVSAATVNRTVTQPLRAILRRCAKTWKQEVQEIDWRQHFLAESQERVREASATEEAALLASIRQDYAPALRFALLTGCRRAEIVGLEWASVDFFNREFTVLGKRKKRRTIPMTKAVYDLLWALRQHHKTAVFTYLAVDHRNPDSKERRPITINGFKTEWRRTKGRTEVTNFRFHDSRHTAATRLVRATGNLKLVQTLLGHSEIATTSRYAHVTKEDLRAGLEAANATAIPTEDASSADFASENKGKLV